MSGYCLIPLKFFLIFIVDIIINTLRFVIKTNKDYLLIIQCFERVWKASFFFIGTDTDSVRICITSDTILHLLDRIQAVSTLKHIVEAKINKKETFLNFPPKNLSKILIFPHFQPENHKK